MISAALSELMTLLFSPSASQSGEESLTIFVDKRKLSQEPPSLSGADRGPDGGGGGGGGSNSSGSATLEALHQLAASYFTDRESSLRRLHHLQIASSAVRVRVSGSASGFIRVRVRVAVIIYLENIKVEFPGLESNSRDICE